MVDSSCAQYYQQIDVFLHCLYKSNTEPSHPTSKLHLLGRSNLESPVAISSLPQQSNTLLQCSLHSIQYLSVPQTPTLRVVFSFSLKGTIYHLTTNMADLLKKRGEFVHPRLFPLLPSGYDWAEQKKVYCEFKRNTIKTVHVGYPRLQRALRPSRFGLVFCHRGYYERASHRLEISISAIAYGWQNGLFLHEVDCRFGSELNEQFIAHDLGPKRVTSMKLQDWSDLTYRQIRRTNLVSRRVDLLKDDFASTYLEAPEMVARLRETMPPTAPPYGLQIDLREDDLAEAMVEFTQHYLTERDDHMRRFLSKNLYRSDSAILKGYNVRYRNWASLRGRASRISLDKYDRVFSPDRLFECPNLTMVFYSYPLVNLALEKKGMSTDATIEERWEHLTLEHITRVARKQISSFVDINIGGAILQFHT